MTTQTMPATANSDVQLVEWSLTGDRDAFRKIVERYQSLVCSITYNATGSLSLSEDIAQETFVAAWKQLPGTARTIASPGVAVRDRPLPGRQTAPPTGP